MIQATSIALVLAKTFLYAFDFTWTDAEWSYATQEDLLVVLEMQETTGKVQEVKSQTR